ncbi:PfkB family carbohydrate kinase [Sodalis ligni]|jgi:ribokinase|uniref:Ribokinase n=1 Tax=Sodalis ligni TaxID=2697027 RepID=A0A4R1N7D3_9GAMM|nr:PfkB family carbohydrate kinase [Sodalis ligni]TCL03194.1 ribokinase [Sodalis ligni]
MFMKHRRENILVYIKTHSVVSVDVLAELFSVSSRTIRNDLAYLASFGLIKRMYGGAAFVHHALLTQLSRDDKNEISQIIRNVKHTCATQENKTPSGKVCILGTFFVDIITKVDHLPTLGEELLLASDISFGPGGKGANQALAASAAGAMVHFVAKVGSDQFGHMAHDHLVSSGISSFTLYQTSEASTGCSIIYVSQEHGESIIAISPGANKKITEHEISAMYHELSEANVFLLHTGNNINAVISAIKLANFLNIMVILNPAPITEEIKPCLPMVNIIIPNIIAASRLSGIEVQDVESAKAAAKVIHSLGVKTVIITMGGFGALLYIDSSFYHFPAYSSVQIDTTGAGDAFSGAFSAMMAKGENILYCVNYASAFASLVVEKEGAANMPNVEEINYRLKRKVSRYELV